MKLYNTASSQNAVTAQYVDVKVCIMYTNKQQ